MDWVWFLLGVLGAILFFGRFYWQWLVSEYRGQYTIPVSFWYMSAAGAVLLFAYAYQRGSPGGTLGLCFNLAIYARNLVLIWREKGGAPPLRIALAYGLAAALAAVAGTLTLFTWREQYEPTPEFWAWSAVWAAGQAMFFGRFAWQWIETEYRGRSVISAPFWYFSLAGLVAHGAYFTHRGDWLLAAGTIADGVPYIRNLMLLRREATQQNESLKRTEASRML